MPWTRRHLITLEELSLAEIEQIHRTATAFKKILLRSVAEHSGFYNAVVIDWDVSRRESPVQWGPLTVAEEGKRVPPHLASAARWRFDDDLWIVFHQAVRGDNARSALGMHSSQETVVSRVKDGRYLSFVEVD